MKYIDKLRNSGLRPTKQRLQICEVLFNTERTFHFTINELEKKIKNKIDNKISLATIYNTVHAFEKKGYLKQIPVNSNQTYFDTNITDHHHFYNLKDGKLIDLENSDVGPINIKRKIDGKKIKSIEVLVKLED
ncbi:Fur family transcriptional regulator [Candidatus Pelagibacter sp.]|uniref:Fur family transcriptional regulator n=1 Tax=Candidatus Pelagibacter sp. TaxID=2024849 RepID=UPI003F838892